MTRFELVRRRREIHRRIREAVAERRLHLAVALEQPVTPDDRGSAAEPAPPAAA